MKTTVSKSDFVQAFDDYNGDYDTIDKISDETIVIKIDEDSFIIQCF